MHQNTAADPEGIMGIPMNITGRTTILPVTGSYGIHYTVCGRYLYMGISSQVFQKILLQCMFVFHMIMQTVGKVFVVGGGKGICCIVYQFSKSIKIKQVPAALFLQPAGNACHETTGIPVVVPSEPLFPYGTFQVCSRIVVGLNTTNEKSTDADVRHMLHIFRSKILPEFFVTFSTHSCTSFLPEAEAIIAYETRYLLTNEIFGFSSNANDG